MVLWGVKNEDGQRVREGKGERVLGGGRRLLCYMECGRLLEELEDVRGGMNRGGGGGGGKGEYESRGVRKTGRV